MADLVAAIERERYRSCHLKKHVEEDFKGQILITNVNGNVDVATFRSTTAEILQDLQNRKASDDIELEKMKIIKASADIIKNDIKQLDKNPPFFQQLKKSRLRTISYNQSSPHQLYCIFLRI